MANLTDKNSTLIWINRTDVANSTTMLPPENKNDIFTSVLDILEYVNSAMLPTFLILGLVGNFLTITIMQTKRYSHLTSRIILTCLACSDTALLLTQPFNKMIVMKMFGFDARAMTNLGCKIFFIIFKSAKMTSSWCLVLLCIERFIAVWFPFKSKTICSKRNTMIALLVVYLFILTFTSFMSYASEVKNGFCFHDSYDVNDEFEVLRFGNFVIMACVFYSLLPSSILVTLTPLIIYKISKQNALRKKMSASIKHSKKDGNKVNAMLIGIVIAYIILVIPNTSLHIISFTSGVNAFWNKNEKGFIIFRDVTQILEQINYAINFFLYVLTSSQFRTGFVDLLLCKTTCRKGNSKQWRYRNSSSSFQNSRRKSPNISTVANSTKFEETERNTNDTTVPESINSQEIDINLKQTDVIKSREKALQHLEKI